MKIKQIGALKSVFTDLESEMALIVGATGSGKSVLLQNMAFNFRRLGGKVIYVTEKHVAAMENAFMCIDKISQEQHQILNKIKFPQEERCPEKVEILHPFTFDFTKYKVPQPLSLYTFPIKDISAVSYAALLGRSLDSPSTKLCHKVAKNLEDGEDLHIFLKKVFEKMSEKDIEEEFEFNIEYAKKNYGIGMDNKSSKVDVNHTISSFSTFKEHYFLQEKDNQLNLDEERWKHIIQDRDTITIFTKKYVEDVKIRTFIDIEILKKLEEYIPKYRKYPLMIVLEEIKILLPRKVNENSAEEVLSNIIGNLLASLRSNDTTIIGTTQSYSDTNRAFTSSIPNDKIFIMKLSANDIKMLKRDFPMNKDNFDKMVQLERGQFIIFNKLLGEVY